MKHIIYSTTDIYSEENRRAAIENLVFNEFWDEEEKEVVDNFGKTVRITQQDYINSLSEAEIDEECCEMNSIWLNDEKANISYADKGKILVFADLGFWNGRRSGVKVENGLDDIFKFYASGSCADIEVYVDENGELKKTEYDHDGTSYYLFRYWKAETPEEVKDRILDGDFSQDDIEKYTERAGAEIAKIYGWEIA